MAQLYLLSTLLMGLLAVAVAVAVARSGQRATPTGSTGGRMGYAEWTGRTDEGSRIESLARSPAVWMLSFVALAFVFLGGAVVYVTDAVPGSLESVLQPALVVVGGGALVGYLFFGTYFAATERSGKSAVGIGVASVVLGLAGLAAIVLTLWLG